MPEGDTFSHRARTGPRARGQAGYRIPLDLSAADALPRRHAADRTTVEQVESRGKWLLIHFSGGATLATHMLMSGSWHIYRPGERWQQPRINMRIVIENSDYVAVGFRVPVAKMLKPQELARAIRIPPPAIDVLSAEFNADEVLRRMIACAETKRLPMCCCTRR
jgi:endonuclease-8